jgi:hypothetical protein
MADGAAARDRVAPSQAPKIKEATMSTRDDPATADDAMKIGEPDEPVDAWTLDELDQLGDLRSLRSAWTGAGDSGN